LREADLREAITVDLDLGGANLLQTKMPEDTDASLCVGYDFRIGSKMPEDQLLE